MNIFGLLLLLLVLCYCTPLCSAQLKFLVLGDWGGKTLFPYTTPLQLEVARAMGEFADTYQPEFVITVGDNFYDLGVSSAEDPRWKYSFENVYTHPSLQIPWYPVAGNRDHYGNITAQLEYSKFSSRWKFTDFNWDRIFTIPNTTATLHIIAFNSWDVTSSSRDPGAPPLDPAKQFKAVSFVAEKLRTSNCTWKIILTHYPIWSAGAHGPFDRDLVHVMEPILLKWRPDIYISGHDHSAQHLVVNGIPYYVCGAGSDCANSWNGLPLLPTGSAYFTFPTSGYLGSFGSVTATDALLTFTFYDTSGNILYSYSHTPQIPAGTPPTTPPVTPPPTPTHTQNTSGPRFNDPNQTQDTVNTSILYPAVFVVSGCLMLLGVGAFSVYLFKNHEIRM